MSTVAVILDIISTPHLLTAAGQSEGIFDWITTKNTEALTAIRGVAITIAIIFVIWAGIRSRGSFVAILISGITAGMLVWIVFNVTDIQDRVGNEVNSAPTPAITAPAFPDQSA